MRRFNSSIVIVALFGLLFTFFMLVPLSTYTIAYINDAESTPMASVYLPIVGKQLTPTPPPPEWLSYVNGYRRMAQLPPVTENASWSYGDWLHARYMVKNDESLHTEDPSNPWYTHEGHLAAIMSNLTTSYDVNSSDEYAVDSWMQAPFHAVGILDPQLLMVGYGSYREADGGTQMGAAIDVGQGVTTTPPSVEFPVMWPTNGANVSLTSHWGEWPSPLTSCPGYSIPSGLPIILQIASNYVIPNVTSHSFYQGGAPLEHCVFDGTTYFNPDSHLQDLGRYILNGRSAIILVPRNPLIPGESYTVSVTARGQTHTWSFTVSSTAKSASVVNYELAPRLDR